jgi:hypothetical protein
MAVRSVVPMMCSVALLAGGAALGQSQSAAGSGSSGAQADDEVVVTGRRLAELRVGVQKARERAWGIFNELNTNNDFDVVCHDETRTFSHARQRICEPRFEMRITSTAAKEYMAELAAVCPVNPADGSINFQACMTGAYAQRAKARAQTVSSEAPGKRDQFSDEIFKVAGENEQFAQAILDFYAAQQKYETARKPVSRSKREDD